MARDSRHINGLENLDKLLESLTDPKFRRAALRNSAKVALQPVKKTMEDKAPSVLKSDVVVRIKVNTDKKMKVKGFVKEDKYNELYSQVTFDSKRGTHGNNSAYGLAMVLNYGRRNPLARVKGDSKFHAWGTPTSESHRYIGTTEGTHFVDAVRFESEPDIEKRFRETLLIEIDKQVKKQDRRKRNGRN